MRIEDLRMGDVLLYDISHKGFIFKLQSWVDCGKANHSAIYVGNGLILEASLHENKTRLFKIEEDFFEKNDVKVLRTHTTNISWKLLKFSIRSYIGKNLGRSYSFGDLAYATLKASIYKLTFGKIDLPMVSIIERDICSELVYEIYQKAGFDIEGVTPNDLDREEIFYTVKDYGGA